MLLYDYSLENVIQGSGVWNSYYINIFQKKIRFLSRFTLAEFPPSHPTPPASCPGLQARILSMESWFPGEWVPVPFLMLIASLGLNPGSRPTLWTHMPSCLSQNNQLHPMCSKFWSYILSNLIMYWVCFKTCNGVLSPIAEFFFCLSVTHFVQSISQERLTALTTHPKFIVT